MQSRISRACGHGLPVTAEQVVVRREPVIKRRGHALIVPRQALGVSNFAMLCERAA